MKTVAVVPVKRLSEAKVRLSPVLTPRERARLVQKMLDHVLRTLRGSRRIHRVAVISPDFNGVELPPNVVRLEQKREGLNEALEEGREWALEEGADALLIIFADLPLLTTRQVREIVDLAQKPDTIVLAPDRHGEGTNALLAHPPSAAHFHFGTHSFQLHLTAAGEAHTRALTYQSPGTSLDIDTPEDLEAWGDR